jgi:hypothetical protein
MNKNIFDEIATHVAESWEDYVSEDDSDKNIDTIPMEDEEEFPSLGQEPKTEPVVRYAYGPVKAKTQNKKKLLVETSFCTDGTEQFPQEMRQNQLRTEAFNALADKDSEETQGRLHKTKMCRSVTTGEPCPHGEKCRFAHSSAELRTAPCLLMVATTTAMRKFAHSYTPKKLNGAIVPG